MEPTVRIPAAAPSHVRVPPELEGLRRLAYNLYWSWHPQARALFARINGSVWARIHSPIPVLVVHADKSELSEPRSPQPERDKPRASTDPPGAVAPA